MRVKNLTVKNKLKIINNSRLVNKKGYINGVAKKANKDKYGNEIKKGLIPSVNTEFDKLKSANIRLNKFNNELKENISGFENSDRYMGEFKIGKLPHTMEISPVCYGNGKFVTVSYESDKAAYSEDGINWTATTLPASMRWRDVCYSNGKFIACCRTTYPGGVASNIIACSEDGINWSQAALPISAEWISICYGNGKFVMISHDNDKVLYSEDGINWRQSALPVVATWARIRCCDGKFIAVTVQNNIGAYSEDGINWVKTTLPMNSEWYFTGYGNGMYIAPTYTLSSVIACSVDGITWTTISLPCYGKWLDVCYADGKFVVVSADNKIIYSYDGVDWKLYKNYTIRHSNHDCRCMCYGDGKFIVTCYDSADVICIDSRKEYNDKYLV